MTSRADQLFATLEMIASLGMTWWVSATVLCAGIVGSVWVKRKEVRQISEGVRRKFSYLIFSFFCTVILFGVVLMVVTAGTGVGLVEACKQVDRSGGCKAVDAYLLWICMVLGLMIGTTSFVAVAKAWTMMWRHISRKSDR
jgi:cytochrome bd-type quinol oxidase subunit 2